MKKSNLVDSSDIMRIKARRIRTLREHAKLSGEELANKIGVTETTIRNWESEERGASIKTELLPPLAAVFGCSIDYLLGLSEWPSMTREYIDRQAGLSNDACLALENLTAEYWEEYERGAADSVNKYRMARDFLSLFLSDPQINIMIRSTLQNYVDVIETGSGILPFAAEDGGESEKQLYKWEIMEYFSAFVDRAVKRIIEIKKERENQ